MCGPMVMAAPFALDDGHAPVLNSVLSLDALHPSAFPPVLLNQEPFMACLMNRSIMHRQTAQVTLAHMRARPSSNASSFRSKEAAARRCQTPSEVARGFGMKQSGSTNEG